MRSAVFWAATYTVTVLLSLAWADTINVPCPGSAPLSGKQEAEKCEETAPDEPDGYLYASASERKTQASASFWTEENAEVGTAKAENEYWRVINDPCSSATGGSQTCKWFIKWKLTTTTSLLKANAEADAGADTAQGYAHVKIFNEDRSSSTSKSVNAYSTGAPESEQKTGQTLEGPVDAKCKGIGEHISGYVQSFSKYDIDGKGEASADSVFADPTILVIQNYLKSGSCGTKESE